jgi:arylsulfatase A-like enzyme
LYVDSGFVDREDLAHTKPGQIKRQLNAEELRYLEDLYDGEVRYVDDRLGELFGVLDRLGVSENTIILVTADHGEEFGDHGGVEHGTQNLHGEVIQVPLIMVGPGIAVGKRVRQPVELADLLPTMADFLGFEEWSPEGLDGRSFVAALSGDPAETDTDLQDVAWSERDDLWSLRTDRWTMIGDRQGEILLYDRLEDPSEQHDVAADQPQVLDAHRELLRLLLSRKQREDRADDAEINEGLRKELEALGYLN